MYGTCLCPFISCHVFALEEFFTPENVQRWCHCHGNVCSKKCSRRLCACCPFQVGTNFVFRPGALVLKSGLYVD